MEEIYKSRNIILDMLNLRNYNVDKYRNFSKDEIELFIKTDSLDFIVTHNETPEKIIHIIYLFDKEKNPIRGKFESILEEKYENIEDKENTEIIFILPEQDTDNILQDICNTFFDIFSFYSQVFFIKNLCYNITQHKHVPIHKLLKKSEEIDIMKKYNIKKNQLPKILRNDPVSKFIGLKKNNVVEIIRSSISGGEYTNYRVCI